MASREFNFDGIVGPTHNYAGLSFGNVASTSHFNSPSNPRAAALEGLAKMRLVAELGIPQAVLPPLCRPSLRLLRNLGFRGTNFEMLHSAHRANPAILGATYSASSMWTANAATVSPSPDCDDGRVHFSPANLSCLLHRSIEAEQTTAILRRIFSNNDHFCVHNPLPAGTTLADEGAANHTRLVGDSSSPGIEIFAFGRAALDSRQPQPQKFPARQTLEASQAIARRHQLNDSRTLFVQQNPAAIDAGVFHNDVISVGNENVLLVHEQAFVDQPSKLQHLRKVFEQTCNSSLHVVEFSAREFPLEEAVKSYLFNSQLLTRSDGKMTMLCPTDCQTTPKAKACLDKLLDAKTPVDEVRYVNLRQSMNNGGGPACLRLRVCLTDEQAAAMHQGIIWTPTLHDQLVSWVGKHYREILASDDLRDPRLVDESFSAIEHLARILGLPASTLLDA